MVKLMPLPSVHFLVLSLLAAGGGLLCFSRRRLGAGFFLPGAAVLSPGGFCARLETPDAAFGGSPARGRPASNTPFTPRAQGELILVVDDEESVLELLSTVLRNHGYQVALARDGVEGLALFSAQPDRIALVLTDLHMPNSSGQSFADLLRPIRPDVRILFMSGMDTGEGAAETGGARSSDPFLLKPFKPAVLLETIHKLLH
jgi:CheY-like chemotaxis protein